MSEDPEKGDIDPAVDKVWAVDVSYYVDYTMYVVAKDRDEANECARAHLYEENENRFTDPDMGFHVTTEAVKDIDWETSEPYGRCHYGDKIPEAQRGHRAAPKSAPTRAHLRHPDRTHALRRYPATVANWRVKT